MRRTLYHTSVKILARDGLLPCDALRQIPRSNIHRWRTLSLNHFKIFDLPVEQPDELVRQFAANKNARRLFGAYVRIVKLALTLAHALPGFTRAIRENKMAVVALIQQTHLLIGLTRALRFFQISVSTFRQWSLQTATDCFNSLTGSCNRIFPNQLSRPEIARMRDLLTGNRFQFWPVSSIAWHALRNSTLPLSLNTWYKYVHKLGFRRERPLPRRKKNSVSIRARRPHRIWHADVTCFETADKVRQFIYLVTDNFSRKILACQVADKVRKVFRRQSIESAFQNVNTRISQLTLITDGGAENDFTGITSIDHKIARVDVHYSNSLIEAHFKVLKYNYLYRKDIRNRQHLEKILPEIISDYNNRPHVSLNGLTPNEAENGAMLDRKQLSTYIQQATQERRVYNQAHRCTQCSE